MAFVRKILFPLSAILLLFMATSVHAQGRYRAYMPEINCIDAKLPLTFSWIDYEEPGKDVPDVVTKKIQNIIIDFCLESNAGDSEQITKAKDAYFNTLRLPYGNLQLFVVILKTPLQYTHCKLFLYDTAANAVSKNTVDYNTWAMYAIDDNTLQRSILYKSFHLDKDDIGIVNKKQSNLLLRRLKHNNTLNEFEEITYRTNGLSLDTVSVKSKVLE